MRIVDGPVRHKGKITERRPTATDFAAETDKNINGPPFCDRDENRRETEAPENRPFGDILLFSSAFTYGYTTTALIFLFIYYLSSSSSRATYVCTVCACDFRFSPTNN